MSSEEKDTELVGAVGRRAGGKGAGIGLQGVGVSSWGQEGAWAVLGLRQVRQICWAPSVTQGPKIQTL